MPPGPELHGVELPRGSRVFLMWASGNRDERVFDDPFRFDLARTPNPHVSFGGPGAHFCLGASLARLEIQVIRTELGQRRVVERRIYPGYVLVEMILDEESWYVVRNTPGVTGFVGMGTSPTPLRPEEVNQIIKRMEAEAPRVKVSFKVGERIRIIDGPFNDFRGTVAEIDMERTKVRVMVSFFGRETPVELDFLQVEKA